MIDGIVTAVAESYEESNCKLVLSYEDDSGNVTTAEQEFTMMVTAPQDDMVMEDMPVMEEEDGGRPRRAARRDRACSDHTGGRYCCSYREKEKKEDAVV